MFWSKIFVESQDSRYDVVEAAKEGIVPAMVEQKNNFFNKFDDFQALIEELKNKCLMAIQHFRRLEAQMVEQAKVMVDQGKVRSKQTKNIMEE